MHAVVWPTVRAASKSKAPARLIKGRRYPHTPRARSLHSTAYRLQSSNSPSNPDDTPREANGPPPNTQDGTDGAAEKHSRGTAVGEPDEIAHKLQQSKELVRRYGSALRRSHRRNRPQDLPPIHIPNWFLLRKVWLRESHPTATQGVMRRRDYIITLKDDQSGGSATLTFPFWSSHRSAAILGQLCKSLLKDKLDGNDVDKFVESITLGPPLDEEAYRKLQDHPQTGPLSQREIAELHLNSNISPIILAEIRATVAASLSTTTPVYNSSFPSTKTNLILHGTTPDAEQYLRALVKTLADDLGADMVSLDAQDLAQIAGDYLGDGSEPSPHGIRSLGYETYKSLAEVVNELKEPALQEEPEEPTDDQGRVPEVPQLGTERVAVSFDLAPLMKAFGFPAPDAQKQSTVETSSPFGRAGQSANEVQLEEMKLSALLEALVDSNELKRDSIPVQESPLATVSSKSTMTEEFLNEEPKFFDYSQRNQAFQTKLDNLLATKDIQQPGFAISLGLPHPPPKLPHNPLIIYVRDIKELNATHYGSRILQKLEDIVRKRRAAGQSIMILGTTCSAEFVPELSANGVRSLQSEGDADYSRTIVVPASKSDDLTDAWSFVNDEPSAAKLSPAEQGKIWRINLRHLHDMLRSLDPSSVDEMIDALSISSHQNSLGSILRSTFSQRVLPYDEVHRVALTALGLHHQNPVNSGVNWAHVVLAAKLLKVSDKVKFNWTSQARLTEDAGNMGPDQLRNRIKEHRRAIKKLTTGLDKVSGSQVQGASPTAIPLPDKRQQQIDQIIKDATKHEKGLVRGIINPNHIKTTFAHVHVPKETVEAVRTLTSLSLLRPDAFNYGVLATDKISGVLLYGPPGTGKTLLAKAVAKESGATVLEVSGSEINDKYVGEGEKNVTAIFSLARKLSPCVVFLDEADAIFGSRDGSKNRVSHREILNQFLKEWDGMNDLAVFVMVATNRPFDLDDAVIRRLPRRLLVDLPTQEDRKKILEIHLRDEQLGAGVDIGDLARRTALYSGSDLKNLAVAAALAAVREENEEAVKAAAKAAAAEAAAKREGIADDAEAEAEALSNSADGSVASPSPSPSSPIPITIPPILTPTPSPPPPSPSILSNLSPPTPSPIQPTTTPISPPPPILSLNQTHTFPAKRTLQPHHFEKALLEISASISEDMTSLNAIKKFDEQFGDRRGRRKRGAYGFGIGVKEGEGSGRVRT